ncbi:MAG: very short patch repair endonuclease [Treponema sp.]|jgi:DNA mismatch endonuclease (patch repair protein)|nr:very short patch repair endonuclease [Treponema sp.]
MNDLTPEQRHKCMSHVKSNDTSIEVLLRKALWHEGIRYRKNVKTLPGKPDIAITKYKIAIFCDGELWHGKDWETKKETIKTNRNYWIPKIERNMARDIENEKKLESMGWIVIRFWGKEIEKNLMNCVNEIMETIYEIKNNIYGTEYEQEYNKINGLLAAEDEPVYNEITKGD